MNNSCSTLEELVHKIDKVLRKKYNVVWNRYSISHRTIWAVQIYYIVRGKISEKEVDDLKHIFYNILRETSYLPPTISLQIVLCYKRKYRKYLSCYIYIWNRDLWNLAPEMQVFKEVYTQQDLEYLLNT